MTCVLWAGLLSHRAERHLSGSSCLLSLPRALSPSSPRGLVAAGLGRTLATPQGQELKDGVGYPRSSGSSGRLEGAAPQRDRLLQVHVGSPRPHDKTLYSSPVTHSVLCSTPQERWSDVPVWRDMGLGSSLCTGLWATGTLQARFVTSSCSESPQPQPATLPLIGSCFEHPGLAWLCAGYFGSRIASPRIQAGPPCFKNQRLSAMRGQYGEESPLPWLR